MKFYQEITLIPDAEIPLNFVWQHVFQQVHIALVENKVADNRSAIAVGFPGYGAKDYPMGQVLRLFSHDEQKLQQLDMARWLNRLSDYVHIRPIKSVPLETAWVCFERARVKSASRIEKDMQEKALRWAKKSGKSLDDCLAELASSKPQAASKLPFIYLYSQETKRHSPGSHCRFPLFIKMTRVNEVQSGGFDCYGFSAAGNAKGIKSAVPHFA